MSQQTTTSRTPTERGPDSPASGTGTRAGQRRARVGREPRSRRGRSPVTAWLAVLLITGAAVYGGTWLTEWRQQPPDALELDQVLLSAQRFSVGSTGSAVVAEIDVEAGQSVQAGQQLATVTVEPADRSAGGRPSTEVLTAPTDAVVISVDQPVGSIVRAGEAVLTLYEPEEFVFVATAPVEVVSQLKIGMSVELTGPGLAVPTTATVHAARVPVSEPIDGDRLSVVLLPQDIAEVSGLIPDLPFRAKVDMTSVSDDAPSVVSISP